MRPLAVAMCDLDAAFLSGVIPIAEPFALGHECIAEVVEIGDAVRGVVPGDVVVVPFQISCGQCPACVAGQTGSCRTVPRGSAYGMQPLGGAWGGALADVLRVPFADAMLTALPDGLDPVALASVADNVPDGYRAVAAPLAQAPGSGRARGRRVGPQRRPVRRGLREGTRRRARGLRRHGSRPSGAGRRARRRTRPGPRRRGRYPRVARQLGRFAITVDASGVHAGLHAALRSTAADGTCTSVAIYFEPSTPLPLLEMYTRGCTLHTGRCHARALIPEVLALIADGRLDPAG